MENECPICTEVKKLVTLECIHKICETCFDGIKSNNKIKCPFCRHIQNIGEVGLTMGDDIPMGDVPINGQKYVLLSLFVDNEMTTGVKVRGTYPTLEQAKNAAEILRKKDNIFDIYIGEVGKWLPTNPFHKTEKNI